MTIAGLLGILGIIVVLAFVPETRGRTVESLEGTVVETDDAAPDAAESPAKQAI